MRKNNFTCLSASILLISSIFSSCVNQDYDLGKEIDLTLSVGGKELSAPIGSTEPIKLSKIIEVNGPDDLIQLKGGEYRMMKEMNVNPVGISIPKATNKIVFSPINIATEVIASVSTNIPNGQILKTTTNPFNTTSNGLPNELIEIKSIGFPISVPSKIKVTFQATGITGNAKLTLLKGYSVELPEFIKSSLPNNKLIFDKDEALESGTSITKEITIDAIHFPYFTDGVQKVTNHQVVINGKIKLDGDISWENIGPSTTTPSSAIGVSTNITVDELEVSKIVGKVDPTIKVIVNPITFTVPDFLSDDAVSLDILDPMISINAINPLDIPIVLEGQLEGWKNGKLISNSTVVIKDATNKPIVIKANTTDKTIVLSRTGTQGSADDDKYQISTLSNLLKTIPDEIRFTMKPTSDKSALHSVELGKDYQLKMDYVMEAPFKFGSNLSIVYNESIDNLNKDIKDIDAKQVSLSTDVENTIPLILSMSATPVGLDKLPLAGVSVTVSREIDSCDKNGNMQESPITIELKENIAGAMKKLDGIQLKVTAKSSQTVNGMPLKENQYIRLTKIKAKASGGITVDLNNK